MIKKSLTIVCLIASIGFANSAFAYGTRTTNDGCKKPRFKSFSPEHKAEIDPGAEVSFTVSGDADPASIVAVAKKEPLKLDVEFKGSFYAVSAKMPASLAGKYARIHVKADGVLGCKGKDGWLLKVRDLPASKGEK